MSKIIANISNWIKKQRITASTDQILREYVREQLDHGIRGAEFQRNYERHRSEIMRKFETMAHEKGIQSNSELYDYGIAQLEFWSKVYAHIIKPGLQPDGSVNIIDIYSREYHELWK